MTDSDPVIIKDRNAQPTPNTMGGTFTSMARAMSDVTCRLTYGSPSYGTWRRAADASLEHSRARRARPHGPTLLDYFARLLIVAPIIGICWVLVVVFA
jgi:hypothetical protein